MARKVDPVPDLYAKAFSSIGIVRARLRALRERVTAPPMCESPEVKACEVDSSESVTAECTPPRERLSTLNEFRAVLANMRSIVF